MNTGHVHVQLLDSFAAAEGIRPQWARWAADNAMLSWDWLAAWWQAYGGPSGTAASLIVQFNAPDQTPLGVLPLYQRTRRGCHELRYMGDGAACTDYGRILCEPGWERAIAASFAAWLQSGAPAAGKPRPDWFELEGHRSADPGWQAVWEELAGRGWQRQQRTLCGSWLVTLPNDWQAYCLGLSKSRRRKITKALKLHRSGDVQFEVCSTPAQIAEYWPEFVALHQRRRLALGEPGCFAAPEFSQFLPTAVASLATRGQAHLVRLTAEARPLGFLLWLENSNGLAVYQSGFEPSARDLEPGHLLNALGLDWAFRRGIRSYDFLRGDEHYKSGWGGLRCELLCTRCVAPRWSSRAKDRLWQAGRWLKARWANGRSPGGTSEQESSVGEGGELPLQPALAVASPTVRD